MQKMVVVTGISSGELNKYFEEGWHLVNMVAAGGEDHFRCYVVIEKDTEQE